MGENTNIEWAHHTFNPWIGCTKVSAACDNCYAETQNNHRKWNRDGWGPHAPRKRTSQAYWRQPLKWNRDAQAHGVRERVFCASLADVFDSHKSIERAWRTDLFSLIAATPYLDWLLLTKRPQNIARFCGINRDWPDNIWLGTTVENQEEANRRIPHLISVPAKIRFLSCEPLLGPVDLRNINAEHGSSIKGMYHVNALTGDHDDMCRPCPTVPRIHWVIAGGESGSNARPSHPEWFRNLRDQCAKTAVPFFFKQWGEYAPCEPERYGTALLSVVRSSGDHLQGRDALNQFDACDAQVIARFGKAKAGRTLDGATYDGVPSTEPDADGFITIDGPGW